MNLYNTIEKTLAVNNETPFLIIAMNDENPVKIRTPQYLYTFHIMVEEKCILVKTEGPIYGFDNSEVAKKLNTSRQNTSQTTKRALLKIFKAYKRLNPTMTSTQVMAVMMDIFNIDDQHKFFNELPTYIKNKVLKDAKIEDLPEVPNEPLQDM